MYFAAMKPVEIAAVGLDAVTGAPRVLLREKFEPHRTLRLTVGAHEAAAILYPATGNISPQPFTADLLTSVVSELGAKVRAVEVTEMHDGTFFARLDLQNQTGRHSLDARPSDAIAIALRVDVPVFVSEALLETEGELPTDANPVPGHGPESASGTERGSEPVADHPAVDGQTVAEEGPAKEGPAEDVEQNTSIEKTVRDFRDFLDNLDPDHFTDE